MLEWRTPTLEEASVYFGGLGTSNVWRWKRNEAEIVAGACGARAVRNRERAQLEEFQSLTDELPGAIEELGQGEFTGGRV